MTRSLGIPPSFKTQGLCTCCSLQRMLSAHSYFIAKTHFFKLQLKSLFLGENFQDFSIYQCFLSVHDSLSQCGIFLHGRYSDPRYLHLTSAFCMTLFWGPRGQTSWFCCLQLKHQSPLSAQNCWVHICRMNKWRTWEPECRTFHFPYIYCRPLADKFLVHQYLSLNTVTAKCSYCSVYSTHPNNSLLISMPN